MIKSQTQTPIFATPHITETRHFELANSQINAFSSEKNPEIRLQLFKDIIVQQRGEMNEAFLNVVIEAQEDSHGTIRFLADQVLSEAN